MVVEENVGGPCGSELVGMAGVEVDASVKAIGEDENLGVAWWHVGERVEADSVDRHAGPVKERQRKHRPADGFAGGLAC